MCDMSMPSIDEMRLRLRTPGTHEARVLQLIERAGHDASLASLALAAG
jgi:hypothetical protein